MRGIFALQRFADDIALRPDAIANIAKFAERIRIAASKVASLPRYEYTLFGSIPRRTAISLGDRSDGDILIRFPLSQLPTDFTASPRKLCTALDEAFREAGWSTTIYPNCVTVSSTSGVIDVVPAIEGTVGALCVPSSKGETWIASQPMTSNLIFKSEDVAHHGMLGQLARLARGWNLSHGRLLQSYHIDCLALNHVLHHRPWVDLWELVASFWKNLATAVYQPCTDPSTAARLDNYLDTLEPSTLRARVIGSARDSALMISDLFTCARKNEQVEEALVSAIWRNAEVSRYLEPQFLA